MGYKLKIKINDIPELRLELMNIYDSKTPKGVAQYSVLLAKHVIERANMPTHQLIDQGFLIHELWLKNEVSIQELRQAALKIHLLARNSKDLIIQTAYRAIGKAVSCGHMKEHGIVASDYAVKLINYLEPNNLVEVKKEREFQIQLLKTMQ